ncbi:MAG: 30S ribosomal protein S20 [Candidatus Nanopelagicales bacterium]
MANIKSQMKRIKTNEKAHERNKAVRSTVKNAIRRVHEAVSAGDATAAQDAAKVANRELDRAVSKGVIHKNQAANRKSAVSKAAASL